MGPAFFGDHLFEGNIFIQQFFPFDDFIDGDFNLIVVDGLGDVIKSALFHGLNRGFNRAVSGDKNDICFRKSVFDFR